MSTEKTTMENVLDYLVTHARSLEKDLASANRALAFNRDIPALFVIPHEDVEMTDEDEGTLYELMVESLKERFDVDVEMLLQRLPEPAVRAGYRIPPDAQELEDGVEGRLYDRIRECLVSRYHIDLDLWKQRIKDLETEQERLNGALNQARRDFENLSKLRRALLDEKVDWDAEKITHRNEIERLKSLNAEHREHVGRLVNERDSFRDTLQQERQRINTWMAGHQIPGDDMPLSEACESAVDAMGRLWKVMSDWKTSYNVVNDHLEQARNETRAREEEKRKLALELNNLEEHVSDVEQERDTLRDEVNTLKRAGKPAPVRTGPWCGDDGLGSGPLVSPNVLSTDVNYEV